MTALTELSSPAMAGGPSALSKVTDSTSHHIPALDGIRGVAILLVMVHHVLILPGMTPDTGLWPIIAQVGISGVDLFFVLSGFLITGILCDSKGRPNYFRNFYARRTLRIFPLYYAVVFIALVVLPALPHAAFDRFADATDAWSYWLYVSNISMAYRGEFRHGVLDVTWSLAIEEQFYLVWPLVVMSLRRRTLMLLCLTLAVFAIALRTTMVLAGVNWVATYLITPCRIDGLAVGSFVALAFRGDGIRWLVRAAMWVAPASAALFALVLSQGAEYYKTALGQIFVPTLVTLLSAALLVATLAGGERTRLSRTLGQRSLRVFGKFSYALYLFHVPVFALAYEAFLRDGRLRAVFIDTVTGRIALCIVLIALPLGLAWPSWHLFEKHFLSLKRYFPSGAPNRDTGSDVWPQDRKVVHV